MLADLSRYFLLYNLGFFLQFTFGGFDIFLLKLFDDGINDYFAYPLCRLWSCRVPEEQDDDLEWEIVSDGKTKRTARS